MAPKLSPGEESVNEVRIQNANKLRLMRVALWFKRATQIFAHTFVGGSDGGVVERAWREVEEESPLRPERAAAADPPVPAACSSGYSLQARVHQGRRVHLLRDEAVQLARCVLTTPLEHVTPVPRRSAASVP